MCTHRRVWQVERGRTCRDSTISEVARLGYPSYVADGREGPQRARPSEGRSGRSARLDAIARRRGNLPEMSVLEEVRVPGEQEPPAVARDTKFRDVLGSHRCEASDGVPTISDDGLEHEFIPAITEQDPRVSAVLRSRRDPAPDDEIGVNVQLDELPPRPEREVLAVAAAQLLEGVGMLPVVRFAKEVRVGFVLTGSEPVENVVEARDGDRAVALEHPIEAVACAVAVDVERRLVGEALPRVTDWEKAQPELVQRATNGSEQSGGASTHLAPAPAVTDSERRSCSRRSHTVESRASFGAKL